MAKYHGKSGALFQGASSGGAAVNVTNLTNWNIDITQDLAECSALGDTWKSFMPGLKGATGSFAGFFADDADTPFDAFDAAAKVKFYGYPAGSTVARYLYGDIWPTNVTIDVPVSGMSTIGGGFTVDGALSRQG